ncbi:hypothetical protein [Pseudomonas purpurea]|uniref:hypothetical protein n=1 Tax=Pseudomonas purpurea TaxID=3136737 RepID=UPI003264D09F
MDALDIEDTSDWLGSPTELETCAHYAHMLENEIQELTVQLRTAIENIFGLVKMHVDVSKGREHFMGSLRETSGQLALLKRKMSDLVSRHLLR